MKAGPVALGLLRRFDTPAYKAAAVRFYKKNPTYSAFRQLRYQCQRRGFALRITREEYDALVKTRPSTCQICGFRGKLHLDHDHKTGLFRGWICFGCNAALGRLENRVVEFCHYLGVSL